ncbi:ubiquitin-like-conjugating enzyme ATG10 isoform X2 [Sesamum indicum]|uniref:Ubiquitin-like-conjugating enzyme ATG10 n=1 Tax=Sesamum indicum TaxID=4182 RepID=A0A6I9TZS7_SESIN|nr:ubiquitin-like-conjugating enzyme ATG10 isoform X2 [Sesamum indicum]
MVVSRDGTLSSTEFYVAASAFSEQWRKFNSALRQWSWVPSPKRPWISHNQEEGYLSVENVILPELNEEGHRDGDLIEKEECGCAEEDEFIDAAVLIQNDDAGARQYDFHVVYSACYRVPVLYFRAYCSDGQPLLLDDIKKDLPLNSVEQLTRSRWLFITQEEHPQLNRPWYTLHPCGTSEWMKLLQHNDDSAAQGEGIPVDKYLISWFSVVGQVFGLRIPLEMLNLGGTQ